MAATEKELKGLRTQRQEAQRQLQALQESHLAKKKRFQPKFDVTAINRRNKAKQLAVRARSCVRPCRTGRFRPFLAVSGAVPGRPSPPPPPPQSQPARGGGGGGGGCGWGGGG
eukprot:COSAG01_NODE_11836_length_1850_cov_1.913192_4_plen_112_part_01